MVIDLDPASVGLSPATSGPVWGVVMDSVFPTGDWYCLAVLGDGTTSIYTSGGYGVIGAGQHESVRAAGHALLAKAAEQLALLGPSGGSGLPAPGMVALRALTFDGQRVLIAPENALGKGKHPASALFYSAQEVLTQVRLIDERQNPG
jgi:hypothetical protein